MPELHTYLANSHWAVGHLDEAIASFRKALSLSPGYVGNRHRIARILLQQGKPEQALAEAEEETDTIYRLTGLSMSYFALGNKAMADSTLAELIEKGSAEAAYQIAEVYGMRGDADNAFKWLDQAWANRDSGVPSTLSDPSFYSVMKDARFEAFLEKIDLADVWRQLPPEWGGPGQ